MVEVAFVIEHGGTITAGRLETEGAQKVRRQRETQALADLAQLQGGLTDDRPAAGQRLRSRRGRWRGHWRGFSLGRLHNRLRSLLGLALRIFGLLVLRDPGPDDQIEVVSRFQRQRSQVREQELVVRRVILVPTQVLAYRLRRGVCLDLGVRELCIQGIVQARQGALVLCGSQEVRPRLDDQPDRLDFLLQGLDVLDVRVPRCRDRRFLDRLLLCLDQLFQRQPLRAELVFQEVDRLHQLVDRGRLAQGGRARGFQRRLGLAAKLHGGVRVDEILIGSQVGLDTFNERRGGFAEGRQVTGDDFAPNLHR
ncbi:hypothetical protein D9M72_337650 [compost metagenome]